MSWSFSLRSPSITPPPRITSPSTIEDPSDTNSLWGTDGDKYDPVDIGSVWEPQINFKETPFTIAKRNGAKQASFGAPETSVSVQKAKKTTPSLSRSVPAASVTRKPAPVFQRPTPKSTGSGEPTQSTSDFDETKTVSTSLAPVQTPQARLHKEGWMSAKELSRKTPEAVKDVFYQPSESPEATTPLSSERSQAQNSSNASLSTARPSKSFVMNSKSSSKTKIRTPAIVEKVNEEAKQEFDKFDKGSKLEIPPEMAEAPPRSSSTIAPSSSPNTFEFYADSQESPATVDSSPPPADPPRQTWRPEPQTSETPGRSVANGLVSPSQAPISRQVQLIRPTPVRLSRTSIARIPSPALFTQPKQLPHPERVINLNCSVPPPRTQERVPSPFLSASDSFVSEQKSIVPEYKFTESTQSKLEKFRNPQQQQLKSFVPLSRSIEPTHSNIPQEDVTSPILIAPTQKFPSQTIAQPPRFGSRSLSSFSPNPHTPPSTHRNVYPTASNPTTTSKFSLPLPIAPSVSKKQRMNFLPLEPIESFQKRKGIVPVNNHYSNSGLEEDEDEARDGRVGGSFTSPLKRKSSDFPPEAYGSQGRYSGGTEGVHGSRYGGDNLFGSSLEFDDALGRGGRGGVGPKFEKVAFGTCLRSFKPQATYSSPSTRGSGGRGRRGRGTARSRVGKSRFGGNRIDEKDEEDDGNGGETEEAKLRRLYRSLD